MKRGLFLVLILIVIVSCKTVQIHQTTQRTTPNAVELGVIGKTTKKIKTSVFTTTAVPVLKEKIRIQASIVNFNTKTYNRYVAAALNQSKEVKVTFTDSVANKVGYAHLEILDKVKLIETLNAEYNESIRDYLQHSDNSIVTSLSTYFNHSELRNLSMAEEVYLINNKPQKYSLELVSNGKPFAMIDLSSSVPFAYNEAFFCWKKERGTISIANLIGQGGNCTKGSYKNVKRLNREQDLFKY